MDDTIATELELRLVAGEGSVPLLADLRYESTDPYAVHVGLHTGEEIVEWTFGRELLSDGVRRPVGEGDVRCWPSHRNGTPVVCLSLSSGGASALFEISLQELVEFLAATYHAVPAGTETDRMDWDATIELLLAD